MLAYAHQCRSAYYSYRMRSSFPQPIEIAPVQITVLAMRVHRCCVDLDAEAADDFVEGDGLAVVATTRKSPIAG